jgi:hypothetical protein
MYVSSRENLVGAFTCIVLFLFLKKGAGLLVDAIVPPFRPARERRNNIATVPHQPDVVPFYPVQEDKPSKTKSSETSTHKNQLRYTVLEKRVEELETKENMDIAPIQVLIPLVKTTLKMIEDHFVDSIDYDVMDDPRTLATGITYDSRTLKEWFKMKSTCPNSNQLVSTTLPAQNKTVKNMIEDQLTHAEIIIKQIEHILEEKNKVTAEARVVTVSTCV